MKYFIIVLLLFYDKPSAQFSLDSALGLKTTSRQLEINSFSLIDSLRNKWLFHFYLDKQKLEKKLDLVLNRLIKEGYYSYNTKLDTNLFRELKFYYGWFGLDSLNIFYYQNEGLPVVTYSKNKDIIQSAKPLLKKLAVMNEKYFEYETYSVKFLKEQILIYEQQQMQERKQREQEWQERKQREQEWQELKMANLKRDYPDCYLQLSRHEYWIGMTKQMLITSVGYPKDINKTITRYSTHEQWVYENKYFYFDGNILTTIQTQN